MVFVPERLESIYVRLFTYVERRGSIIELALVISNLEVLIKPIGLWNVQYEVVKKKKDN